MPRSTADRPTGFIRSIEVRPGQPVTIAATHVEQEADGYHLRLGAGRQASTAGAAE